MKYIVVLDLKESKGFECHELRANNLVEAMSEGKHFWKRDAHSIRIAERVGRIEQQNGHKLSKFREIICYCGRGWNPCDNEHAATWNCYKSIKHRGRVFI